MAINVGDTFFGGSRGSHGSLSIFASTSGVGSLVSLFLNIVFVVAGIILLFYFIAGGIAMIGSSGQNDPQKMEQAKKTLTSAFIGFVIVFVSYWIVQLMASLFGISNAGIFGALFGAGS